MVVVKKQVLIDRYIHHPKIFPYSVLLLKRIRNYFIFFISIEEEKWMPFDEAGKEFIFIKDQKNYHFARRACMTEGGGKLFEPRDPNFTNEIIKQARKKGIDKFWLAIHNSKMRYKL